jgi:hypothetical protein
MWGIELPLDRVFKFPIRQAHFLELVVTFSILTYCLIKRSYVMVQLELLLVTLEWAVVERGYVAQSQSMMAVTEG